MHNGNGIYDHRDEITAVFIRSKVFEDCKSCLIGKGTPGNYVARKVSEKYLHVPDPILSNTLLLIIHESGKASHLINEASSYAMNQVLVIIAGSLGDTAFVTMRDKVLACSPPLLWTISDDIEGIKKCESIIQPQKNESITYLPSGKDFVEGSYMITQALAHCIHDPGLTSIDFLDVARLFGGSLTSVMYFKTENNLYAEEMQKFISFNMSRLRKVRSALLAIFAGPWFSDKDLEKMTNTLCDPMPHDSNILISIYIIEKPEHGITVSLLTNIDFA